MQKLNLPKDDSNRASDVQVTLSNGVKSDIFEGFDSSKTREIVVG